MDPKDGDFLVCPFFRGHFNLYLVAFSKIIGMYKNTSCQLNKSVIAPVSGSTRYQPYVAVWVAPSPLSTTSKT
ncbi:hypothetical protein SAMN05720591_11118 [Halolactibacillus alkaliphilus]|nr:hypothetical protein SAMN05720591_11118 [Halolactibacillus alkaliphilus]